MKRLTDKADLLYTVLFRGSEQFVFIFTPETSADAIRQAGVWADREDLSFDWESAARCWDSINKQVEAKA